MPEFAYGFRDNPSTAVCLRDGAVEGNAYAVLSFFSGCGGLDLGFLGGFSALGIRYERHPFEILEARDLLQDAVGRYAPNLSDNTRHTDLTQTPMEGIPAADVLIGGFPCQDFSSSGPKTGLCGKRGNLYKVLIAHMRLHRPKAVVGENASYLAHLGRGKYLATILSELEKPGYHFDVWNLYAPDYGVPQSRRRLPLIGVRDGICGFPVKPAPATADKPVTISQALRDLGEVTDERIPDQSQCFVSSRATSGGSQGDRANNPRKVAYCIRANARGRIQFHYRLGRRLAVRECARLQTFPGGFVLPHATRRSLTQIGNAVPPVLGHHVAKSVAAFMNAVEKMRGVCQESKTATLLRNHAVQEGPSL